MDTQEKTPSQIKQAYMKNWREENKAKILAYRVATKDKMSLYYQTHKEQILAQQAEYRKVKRAI